MELKIARVSIYVVEAREPSSPPTWGRGWVARPRVECVA
jgi:hypothetical protein